VDRLAHSWSGESVILAIVVRGSLPTFCRDNWDNWDNQMAGKAESPSRDEVLKRMLKMPPTPHKPLKGKPTAKKAKKKAKRA
jgi:hypothetical protein